MCDNKEMAPVLRPLLVWLTLCSSALAQNPEPPEVIWDDGPLSAYFNHGYAVAWLGDIDADDTDDYAASAPGEKTVYVYSGATKTEIASLTGEVRHGHALTGIGDVSGDGVPDFAAATPYANSNRGEVRVYSGATFVRIYTLTGSAPGDYFGWGLASVGDTDSDGVPDLLIRSYRDEGQVSVHSGVDGSLRYTLYPTARYEYMGEGLAGIEDLNGDGAADFLVGLPGRSLGEVVLYSGADGSVMNYFNEAGTVEFGAAVCSIGDLDGDQVGDIVIGAPGTPQLGQGHAGEVRVYSGKNYSQIYHIRGTEQSARFGELVADGGDYNGDGVADFLAASPGADGMGLHSPGKVELFSGSNLYLLGFEYGNQNHERMPTSLAGFGDAHRDLHPDYLIGNSNYGSGERGIVRLWGAPSAWLTADPLVAGQTGTLRASDCRPGGVVTLWASLRGSGPSVTPYGNVLLSPPYRNLGTATASLQGVAEFTNTVPIWLSGFTVYFQAAESIPTQLTTATQQLVQ